MKTAASQFEKTRTEVESRKGILEFVPLSSVMGPRKSFNELEYVHEREPLAAARLTRLKVVD